MLIIAGIVNDYVHHVAVYIQIYIDGTWNK